ncbi:mechanosensitive ion channel [Alistipes sp. dk3620]|nr:mechanosensitive ion channel [Alistipes sp.]MBS5867281.1 mechanosensitive ion channel [Alistipes indistinctus]MQX28098.1 mechanosensitive ion channel [Alistipes sp. dk3620]QGA24710.1 mechanosensitive ion channel [Alistipes sp. dk3624]RHR62607.1 mechanosensitive ion channel family protein [Alistipes sp. AF17-16]HIV60742.1 mechanosensitive ion channel family protein [Candidatus Alistipes pullistercoris]
MYGVLRELGFSVETADVWDRWVVLGFIVAIAFVSDFVCRQLLLRVVKRIVARTKATWDDILFEDRVLRRLCHIVPPVLIYFLLPLAFPPESGMVAFVLKLLLIYVIAVVLRFVNAFLKALHDVADQKEELQGKPLKGLMQTGQVIAFFVCIILIISILIDKSPARLLAGLGASAAILMLVFKDSIMGLVSGIQLTANDMLHVGDWISMSKYGVNGRVTEVTLNTVKVRNWDNTIVTVPPYLLISDSFQNWRPMQDSGGRRVMRSVNIDMNSVRFCTPEMLDRFRKIRLLKDYIDETERLIAESNEQAGVENDPEPVNGLHQTNLGVFRAYLERYLRSLAGINQEMMLMVRQLQPTEKGLPVELYFFSKVTEWTVYEKVQADVFDHVLAVIPEFGLRVFQNPAGSDVRDLKGEI